MQTLTHPEAGRDTGHPDATTGHPPPALAAERRAIIELALRTGHSRLEAEQMADRWEMYGQLPF